MKTHTPGPWKVVPCPIHHGKHPFHDARWVMTADAVVEHSEHVPNDWHLTSGSIICQMRDGDPQNAHLIAAAPELLAALEMAMESLDAVDVPQEWDCRSKVRAAIAKATGGAL